MYRYFLCAAASLFVFLNLAVAQAPSLATRWAKEVKPESVLAEYPRPQMVRTKWLNLNGPWQYAIREKLETRAPTQDFDGSILVPFAIESALSGVKKSVSPEQRLWYRRTFTIPHDWRGQRVLLHFGAVDWHAIVHVNNQFVADHRGGYDPFSADITQALKPGGEQELVVNVLDPTDSRAQPRGKQVSRPHGIWYTAVTGIWQSVWLEPVPDTFIGALRITPNVDRGEVDVVVRAFGKAPTDSVHIEVLENGRAISSAKGTAGKSIAARVPDARLWSPDSPHLYDLRVTLGEGGDVVQSYFGMRKIEAKPDAAGVMRMMLNGKPLFQFGPLDQGWWPDGLYTAPTDEALKYDIEVTRKFGFNMCRKHVKVEPDRWYYWADKLGLLVWQDMPSCMAEGRRHGVRPGAEQDVQFAPDEQTTFRAEWQAIMNSLHNHPSIVVWVPFNEGWGQHDTNVILAWTKEQDPSRLVDGPSGWEDRAFGDLKDMHKYPGPGMFPAEERRVSVLGEFGGLGLPLEGHTWLNRDNWGYRTYQTQEELLRNYERLIQQLPPLISSGLAAAVYTQTTDVEVEVNGLLTYDRAVAKLPIERLAELHRRLYLPPPQRSVLVPTSEKEPQKWRYTVKAPAEVGKNRNSTTHPGSKGKGALALRARRTPRSVPLGILRTSGYDAPSNLATSSRETSICASITMKTPRCTSTDIESRRLQDM